MNAKNLATEIVAAQSTAFLVESFEATENDNQAELPEVRGWLMDELEQRDADAFDAWLESNEGSPRRFFLGEEAE